MENTLLSPLAPQQRREVQERLMNILEHQARLYTAGLSSSLPEQTAAELLHSICWCLQLYLRENGQDSRALLGSDELALFDAALRHAEGRAQDCRRLYISVCAGAPMWVSRAMRDTLGSIRDYFLRYNVRFFAHAMPSGIDYQLCLPAQDELEGTAFTADYLVRLGYENTLIRAFPKEETACLLQTVTPGYYSRLMGVYDLVLTNAVGAYLSQGQAGHLSVPESARPQLRAALGAGDSSRFAEGAARMCAALGIADAGCAAYASGAARAQWPRIRAAMDTNPENVFIALRQ